MFTEDTLQKLLEKVIADNYTASASVITYDNGQTIRANAGYRNLENQIPTDETTVYAIGSASKAFGATSLCILADDGKLSLDEPIKTYIPELQLYDDHATKTITARDLLCHRTGLALHNPAVFLASPDETRENMLNKLKYYKPYAPPRSSMSYNNIMYMLATYLCERLSGMSYDEFITERILKPLGMTDTLFKKAQMQAHPLRATGYDYDHKAGEFVPLEYCNVDLAATAGCIYSTPADMIKWVAMHANCGQHHGTQIVSQKMMTECHRPQITMPRGEDFVDMSLQEVDFESYGLGWFIESFRGRRIVYHGGKMDGFQVMQCFVPGTGYGFTISTNANLTSVTSILLYALLDMHFGDGTNDWNKFFKDKYELVYEKLDKFYDEIYNAAPKDTKISHSAEELSGTYINKGYGEIKILCNNGTWSGTFNTHRITLEHYCYNTFLIRFVQTDIFKYPLSFDVSQVGKIQSISVDFEPSCGEKIVFLKQ